MPLFEFQCSTCEMHFEDLVSRDETPRCPKCESKQVKKKLSVFAVSGGGAREASAPSVGPCGSCGHPDGPGSCRN